MAYRTRIKYSAEQKAEIWDRWQRGESLTSIGRLFDRPSSSVFNMLAPSGGIRPPPRRRSRLALTLAEREEISRGLARDLSLRAIANRLGRAPSTISREVNRNGGLLHYRASRADQAAWDRAHRPKPCKLVNEPALSRIVANKLRSHWSPEQIAGWLKRTYPEHENLQVSHETIYRSLFIRARGALKKELQQHLRSQRAIRRSRHASHKGEGRGEIPNSVSIRERPACVEDRAIPGHWEGDLIPGSALCAGLHPAEGQPASDTECPGAGSQPDQVEGPVPGGTCVPCTEMPVRDDQGALPGAGEKCQPSVCRTGTGQSGDGEAAVIADLSGSVRPEFADLIEPGKLK